MLTFAARQTLDGPPSVVQSVSHQPAQDRVTVFGLPLVTAGPLTDLANWVVTVFPLAQHNPLIIRLVGNNIRLLNPAFGRLAVVTNCRYVGGPPFYTTDDYGVLQPFDVPVPFP